LVSPAFRVAVYGEQHPKVAMGFKNLGGAYYFMGKFPQSEQYARKAADLYTSLYGEAHVQTANAYNNLSMAVLAYGDKVSALDYALKALVFREAQSPPRRSESPNHMLILRVFTMNTVHTRWSRCTR
jgi:tetratricopeptide (TPR) repeat protein